MALSFGARYRLAPVLTGVAIAYATVMLVSATVGGLLGAALPTRVVGIGGGVVFFGFALWTLRSGDHEHEAVAQPDPRHVVVSVAAAMFVAELGDKTMLATATLAARENPVMVWIGGTVGIILAGSIGVLVGRYLGTRLPERATRIAAATLFAVFGTALIVTSI